MTVSSVSRSTAAAASAVHKPDAKVAKSVGDQVLKHGGMLELKGDSYFVRANVQTSAGKGAQPLKVDRELAKAIMRATEDRGTWKTAGDRSSHQINASEMQRIIKKVVDGGKYGEGEAVLVKMLFAACDDRKSVKLNGTKIELTDPSKTGTNHTGNAEYTVKHEMAKFWGGLGAKVRWSDPVVNTGA
jgi:hypothetical protein